MLASCTASEAAATEMLSPHARPCRRTAADSTDHWRQANSHSMRVSGLHSLGGLQKIQTAWSGEAVSCDARQIPEIAVTLQCAHGATTDKSQSRGVP